MFDALGIGWDITLESVVWVMVSKCGMPPTVRSGAFRNVVFGGVLLSHTLSSAVPSALEGLASGFGMGPGVSPPLWPP